ncbi:MAG TPA: hypothetical protein VGF60_12890, partial [Xanthobacteraceae bacterium]
MGVIFVLADGRRCRGMLGGRVTDSPRDHHIRLSVARRMVADYMWAASGVARVDVASSISFGDVIRARNGLDAAPSWTAIFTKAFAIVAAEIPQLRQFYMKLLWPHLFEYGESTACILQEREILGDIGLFPLRIRKPDGIPLAELTKMIRRAADAPIDDSPFGRVVVAVSRLPLPFRRLLWSLCLNVPRLRRHGLGTFGISSVARWHSELGTSRTPLSCLL